MCMWLLRKAERRPVSAMSQGKILTQISGLQNCLLLKKQKNQETTNFFAEYIPSRG